MQYPILRVLVAVLVLVAAGPMAMAVDYYVDAAKGSDTYNGQSASTPWKTIQKAAGAVSAGSTCYVAPGQYEGRVTITRSGTEAAPIVFKATGAGVVVNGGFLLQGSSAVRYVVIDGFTVTTPINSSWDVWGKGCGIGLINTQYCEVRNCHVNRTMREGILVYAQSGTDSTSSSNNKIRNNKIEYAGTYAGIAVTGAAQLVEGNDISHSIQHPLYPTLSTVSGADADGIKFGGRDHVFRGNYIHDITMSDTGNVSPHIDGFQTFGPAYNILFEGNHVNLSPSGSQMAMISQVNAPVRDLTFRNNVFTGYRGLNIWGYNPYTEAVVPLYRVNVLNNTFNGMRTYDVELHDCPDSVVKNNIISATGQYLWTNSSPAVSNNAVPGTLKLYAGDKRVTDPMFVDVAKRDFHLKAGSPCIDAGVNVGLAQDFDGRAVPQGSAPDIGAFEYASGTTPPPPPATAPVITLKGSASVTVNVGTAYVDAGATARDSAGRDITSAIKVTSTVDTSKAGTYTVTYNVTDSAGLAATPVVRTVTVIGGGTVGDTTAPVIKLNGSSLMFVRRGGTFTDPGVTATDNVDGNITSRVVRSGSVNTAAAGIYRITYNVKDTAGNAAKSVTRTVLVY